MTLADEVSTGEPLGVEMAFEKLKRYKSPENDKIPAEVIQAESSTMHSKILKLINFVWNKIELPEQWKATITLPIDKKFDKTDCSNYQGMSPLSTYYYYYYGSTTFSAKFWLSQPIPSIFFYPGQGSPNSAFLTSVYLC
jgi:hypothetical protein